MVQTSKQDVLSHAKQTEGIPAIVGKQQSTELTAAGLTGPEHTPGPSDPSLGKQRAWIPDHAAQLPPVRGPARKPGLESQ